jgi:hypothetical protein
MEPTRGFFLSVALGLLAAMVVFIAMFELHLGAGGNVGVRNTVEILARKEGFAQATPGTRILVVGGSGVLFGVKAGMITEATGIPAFNLGVTAGVGGKYIMHRVAQIMRPGDIVLLILEYDLHDTGTGNFPNWIDPYFIDFMTQGDPDYLRAMPWRDQMELAMRQTFRALRKGIQARFKPDKSTVDERFYTAENINEHGDMIRHHREEKPPALRTEYHGDPVALGVMDTNGGGWPDVRDFLALARERGVRVIAAYSNVADDSAYAAPEFGEKVELLRRFYTEHGAPMLGQAADAFFPGPDAFDTVYHPVHEAAEARTARLIELLRPHLDQGAAKTVDPAPAAEASLGP